MSENDKLKKKLGRNLFRLISKIVLLVGGCYLLTGYVLGIQVVDTDCMYPMVNRNDVVVVDKISKSYVQDDVILFQFEGQTRYGRIVGQSNDVVTIDEDGLVRINGYLPSGIIDTVTEIPGGITYPYTIPQGEFFILCDNASNSADSRFYGAIDSNQIKGKIIMLFRKNSI